MFFMFIWTFMNSKTKYVSIVSLQILFLICVKWSSACVVSMRYQTFNNSFHTYSSLQAPNLFISAIVSNFRLCVSSNLPTVFTPIRVCKPLLYIWYGQALIYSSNSITFRQKNEINIFRSWTDCETDKISNKMIIVYQINGQIFLLLRNKEKYIIRLCFHQNIHFFLWNQKKNTCFSIRHFFWSCFIYIEQYCLRRQWQYKRPVAFFNVRERDKYTNFDRLPQVLCHLEPK